MHNILFYGNCQLVAVSKTLNLSQDYNIYCFECWKTDINEECFRDIIINCDIIITQHVSDNYRDVEYLSTSYIIKHRNQNSKLIIFDSCHFDFYYFDLTYKMFNNNLLHNPFSYHYNKMMECYNNNKSIEYYITHFANNIDLKTSEELETIAQNSLNELKRRYINNQKMYNDNNMYLIHTYEYINDNYKDKLLFHSMNHPTKYLIQFICTKIIDILQIQNTINYDIDVLVLPKCILYKCISKNVNFDINNHNALTLDNKDIHEFTQLYYDAYKEIGFQ